MSSVKIVFQCCSSAKLLVEGDIPEACIGKGLIAYVAFLKECSDEDLQRVAETICTVRLISDENNKLLSVVDSPCDLLIIPQFCLAGKLKGKCFQYHSAVPRTTAELLYPRLVKFCDSYLKNNSSWSSKSCKFFSGTFGIRQILSLETNGPFTHTIELLGKKVRIKCNPTDKVGDLKKLIAAQTGTNWERIVLKKWYTIFKDHITLQDYEINDGMNLELYYQ
ncbi:unnamed protein product [Trichobilharzia regenti]|nr:unnamed protein product [Trichobilharzia regenti]